MERFRTCLDDCGLADLGFSGYEYTWNNRREGADNIQARLDSVVRNVDFIEIFPATSVEHIMTEESNHLALLIRVADSPQVQRAASVRGFKYEEMWTRHEGYTSMIEQTWEAEDRGERGGCMHYGAS
jgi:hypothetical protein